MAKSCPGTSRGHPALPSRHPLRDELPEEYRPNFGLSLGLDGMLCGMLGVAHADLIERMRGGGTDEEILEWCFEHGRRPNEEDILMFNAFLTKRGWRDSFTEALEQMKRERGFQNRTDIQTFFDFHKADEEGD